MLLVSSINPDIGCRITNIFALKINLFDKGLFLATRRKHFKKKQKNIDYMNSVVLDMPKKSRHNVIL